MKEQDGDRSFHQRWSWGPGLSYISCRRLPLLHRVDPSINSLRLPPHPHLQFSPFDTSTGDRALHRWVIASRFIWISALASKISKDLQRSSFMAILIFVPRFLDEFICELGVAFNSLKNNRWLYRGGGRTRVNSGWIDCGIGRKVVEINRCFVPPQRRDSSFRKHRRESPPSCEVGISEW